RASAAAAAADAAARMDTRKAGPSAIVYIVGAAFVVVAGLALYFALNQGGNTPAGGTNAGTVAGGTTTSGGGAGTTRGGATSRLPIAIDSTPAGAKITLNGVDTGKVTPNAIDINPTQANTFELSLKGYETAAVT